jgi:hypothetical protein
MVSWHRHNNASSDCRTIVGLEALGGFRDNHNSFKYSWLYKYNGKWSICCSIELKIHFFILTGGRPCAVYCR